MPVTKVQMHKRVIHRKSDNRKFPVNRFVHVVVRTNKFTGTIGDYVGITVFVVVFRERRQLLDTVAEKPPNALTG